MECVNKPNKSVLRPKTITHLSNTQEPHMKLLLVYMSSNYCSILGYMNYVS